LLLPLTTLFFSARNIFISRIPIFDSIWRTNGEIVQPLFLSASTTLKSSLEKFIVFEVGVMSIVEAIALRNFRKRHNRNVVLECQIWASLLKIIPVLLSQIWQAQMEVYTGSCVAGGGETE
jgi:hypothetical protein